MFGQKIYNKFNEVVAMESNTNAIERFEKKKEILINEMKYRENYKQLDQIQHQTNTWQDI